MRTKHFISLVLLLLAAPLQLQAQDKAAPDSPGASAGYAPAIAYPDGGFSWLDHASTAEEGILRGAGAYAEGVGKANYYTSLAAMNYQEATRRAIENAIANTEAYYTRKDLWHDQIERYRRKPLDMEGYQRLASSRSPERLTIEQYNVESGTIRWPYPLDAAIFAKHRKEIEKLLSARSVENSGWGSRNFEQVRQAVASMRETLEAGRAAIDTANYIHAVQFLDSVEWEARAAPGERFLTAEPR